MIYQIEACYLSPLKVLLFIVLSVTIVPLLLVKWSNKVYRLMLYSFTDINDATHVIVHGPRN